MNRIYKSILIIILIILSIFLSGCFNGENNKDDSFYNFKAEITCDMGTNYSIVIPLVIDLDKETVSPIMDELTINGQANVSYVNTEFGKALRVIGKGNIELEINKKSKISPSTLSMLYDSDNDGRTSDEYDNVQFWINLTHIENESLYLKQQFDMKGGGFTNKIIFEGDIFKGLQKINGTLIGGFK